MSDLFDPPARGAEQKGFADAALEDHLLVQLTDSSARSAFAGEEDAVESAVWNRAAIDNRDALRPFASRKCPLQPRPRDARAKVGEFVGRIASRQHVEYAFVDRSAQIREWGGGSNGCKQVVDRPRLDRHHRDDLLCEHVEGVA